MAAIAVCGLVGQAQAAVVTFFTEFSNPSAAAVAAGAPVDGVIKFFLTSNADIVSINNVVITTDGGTIFQVPPPFGSNVEPPGPLSVSANPELEADSWITTPGATSLLGPDMPGDGTSTWSDLTDDGPQTNFHFAQITVPGHGGVSFRGRVALNDSGNIENVEFNLVRFPEPSSMVLLALGSLNLLGAARRRRV
jgi:hypothetical protein